MTDNPMSSAHQKVSGQEAMVDVDCCSIQLSYSRRNARADLNRQPTVPITTIYGPQKYRRIKNELGINVLYH